MPFVQTAFALSHRQLEWEVSEFRSWEERLAQSRQLVTNDPSPLAGDLFHFRFELIQDVGDVAPQPEDGCVFVH